MKNYTFIIFVTLLGCSCTNDRGSKESAKKINLAQELNTPVTEFETSVAKDTILFGDKGTVIFIESNSFVFADGTNPQSPIKLKIKEYYSTSDIVLQNLSTVSNNQLLETNGMVNIQAFSDGKELSLKNGKEIIIHFPKNGNENKMQLFSSIQRDSNSNTIAWVEEPTSEGYEIDSITPWILKYEDLDTPYMTLQNGTNIWTWLKDEIALTKKERDYVRLRDIEIYFDVSKTGTVTNVKLKEGLSKRKCKRLVNLIENIPPLTPFTRNNTPIKMESSVSFLIKFIPPPYKGNANYLRSIENKYSQFLDKSINDIDQMELNFYIFNSAKLGWLNCDRFINDPSPKVDMFLNLKNPENLMVKLVYKDYKSVIIPRFDDKTHQFNTIPENKNVTLIVIRQKRGQIDMSITKFKTKAGEINNLDFKEYTMGDLKIELEKLN